MGGAFPSMPVGTTTFRGMVGGGAIRMPRASLDPRYGQIMAQTIFLVLELTWLDFGPSLAQVAVLVGGALLLDAVRARVTGT